MQLTFDTVQPLSIFEFNQRIGRMFSKADWLRDVWVEGEVSNFKRYASGHAYFTLKDDRSQLKCVMWKTSITRHSYLPTDGERVRAHGSVDTYIDNGIYQLYADVLQPAGLGDLHQQFEQLKVRLQAEGLFDSAHKRPLPLYPRLIGVVTSPSAAAFQDIQNVLTRRYPLARVLLSPTIVQGDSAPPRIAAAIRALCEHGECDVILLARGGGSIEDLWAFNDERVARAVYESIIPIVTGVGHETDFTIVDFVSDQRAPTPSAGAELITPDMSELRASLFDRRLALADAMQVQIDGRRSIITAQRRSLRHLSPRVRVQNMRQRLDSLNTRGHTAAHRGIERLRERIRSQRRALDSANPANILARGYALVYRTGDNKRLSDAIDAAAGTGITVQLQHGLLKAIVKDRSLDG